MAETDEPARAVSGEPRGGAATPWQDALLLALAWIGGYVDALSYLGLGDVLVANMTGNTVLLGVSLGQGRIRAGAHSLTALGGFALGVLSGSAITRRSRRRGTWSHPVTAAVALECAALFALAATWHLRDGPFIYVLIALAALAMGLQSHAVRRVGVPDVATTYVTGTLTGVLERIASRVPVSSWRLPAAVWAVYGLGAVAGGIAHLELRALAVWPATAIAGAVVVLAVRRQRV